MFAALCENGASARLLARRLAHGAVSLERDRRERWTNLDLEGALGRPPWPGLPVLAYAMGAAIARRARSAGWAAPQAPMARLKEQLDDKREARRLFAELSVPAPRSHAFGTGSLSVRAIRRRVGLPCVVQPLRGSNGHGVRLVGCEDDLKGIEDHGPVALASEWVDGPALNLHVAVDGASVAVAPWSVQATGISGLGGHGYAYGGNDFNAGRDLPAAVHDAGAAVGRRVGEALAARGWRGLFGLDAVLGSDGLRLLEVNPRLQGSSWLLAEAQARAGERPLGASHRDLLLERRPLPARSAADAALAGAFLVLRAERDEAPLELRDGRHRLAGDRLERTGEAFGLGECADDEVLVDGMAERPVRAGAAHARLASWRQLLEADGRTLTPWGRAVVAAARRARADAPCGPS